MDETLDVNVVVVRKEMMVGIMDVIMAVMMSVVMDELLD